MLELGWDDMREQIGFHSTSCIETTHETLSSRQEAYLKHPKTDAVINQCSLVISCANSTYHSVSELLGSQYEYLCFQCICRCTYSFSFFRPKWLVLWVDHLTHTILGFLLHQ